MASCRPRKETFWWSVLGLLGMTLIGSASLFRAYRTTIALYQGQFSNRKGTPARSSRAGRDRESAAQKREPRRLLLEARLPAISEPVSAVALAGFRSLVRAPEAKMMLLSPVIMGFIFGSMLWRDRAGHFGADSARWSRSAGWCSCSLASCS